LQRKQSGGYLLAGGAETVDAVVSSHPLGHPPGVVFARRRPFVEEAVEPKQKKWHSSVGNPTAYNKALSDQTVARSVIM